MTRHRSPRLRRASQGPSRSHRHDWLQAALVEEILAIADLIALKRAEGCIDKASVYLGGRPPAGPALREDACDGGANTPSMPR